MTSFSELRDGLKANLETVAGLRAHDIVPGQINPPATVVTLDRIVFGDTFDGTNEYFFVVRVFVSRADERTGQNLIDGYLGDGADSLKAAVESDQTLGGGAFSTLVIEANNYGTVEIEGVGSYITIDLLVTVGA